MGPAVATLALGLLAAAPPEASAATAGGPAAVVKIVADEGDAADLVEHIRGMLVDAAISAEVARSSGFVLADAFRLDAPDAARPTVWIEVAGRTAHVRAGDVGRNRFVLRDLDVGRPLSEVDRERVGQIVSASLAIVTSPVERDRDDAQRAPAEAKGAPRGRNGELEVGAGWGATKVGDSLRQGPCLSLAAGGTRVRLDPEVWFAASYAVSSPDEAPAVGMQTLALRAGASVEVWPLRVGVGIGLDREHLSFRPDATGVGALELFSDGILTRWEPAARFFLRMVSPRVRGVAVSGTLIADVVSSHDEIVSSTSATGTLDLWAEPALRLGFFLEVAWRS
jgi:hypothetical protein